MHKWVLHVEVLGVVEDGDDLIRLGGDCGSNIFIGDGRVAILGDSSHGGW